MALSAKPGLPFSHKLRSERPAFAGSEPLPPPFIPGPQALREAVRDPAELCRLLELPPSWVEPARRATESFGLFAPRGYVARMKLGDPADPLLRQVLPLGDELVD